MKAIYASIFLLGIVLPVSFCQEGNPYKAPEWAKKVVWYQIFPERFRNGDPKNDPTFEDIKGAWPHDNLSPWQIHPWTSDWYKFQEYEKKNMKDIWFNLQRRRYGGDIQGILDKLDYLQRLGIGAIYLNPVFQAPSSHKYDAASYHHIDPNFGPDPKGDREKIAQETPDDPKTWVWTSADRLMLTLIAEAHKRGMKIIFDGVFNHMGINSWAFQDVLKKQQDSKYKDWFEVKSWDDPEKKTQFEYAGWFGVRELPEIKEDENGIVAGPREYIYNITRRWMDPDQDGNPGDGIDGWRLDVAFCVKHAFWKEWRKLVKSINPEAYLTAEVVDTPEATEPYLEGDEFDAVMNYNFAFACAEYFIEVPGRILEDVFDDRLRAIREIGHPEMGYVMQNLFGSHDTNRLGSHIVNAELGGYRRWAQYFPKSKAENPKYNTRKPDKDELMVQKLFVIFQMTYVGAPMIYYGDEVGMWGANDPCCRKPMVWEDLRYEDESCLPSGESRQSRESVEVNKGLWNHYQKMIAIRNAHPVLQLGSYETLITDPDSQVFGFMRTHEKNRIVVVLNNSKRRQKYKINLIDSELFQESQKLEDILHRTYYKIEDGCCYVNLGAKDAVILISR